MRALLSACTFTVIALSVPVLAWAGGGGGPPGAGGGGGSPEPGLWAMMLAGAIPGAWAVKSALSRTRQQPPR